MTTNNTSQQLTFRSIIFQNHFHGYYSPYFELTIDQRINYKSYKPADRHRLLWAVTDPITFQHVCVSPLLKMTAHPNYNL